MDTTPISRESQNDTTSELKAAVAARRELGQDMEDQVLEAFLARIQHQVDAQVASQLAQSESKPIRRSVRSEPIQVEVIVGSFALAIPLLAIAGGIAHSIGIVVVICGLVAVNLLYFIDRWIRFQHH